MNGSYSTYAIDPVTFLEPFIRTVSSMIEYKRVDFPQPTLPTTTTKSPAFISKFMSYRFGSLISSSYKV